MSDMSLCHVRVWHAWLWSLLGINLISFEMVCLFPAKSSPNPDPECNYSNALRLFAFSAPGLQRKTVQAIWILIIFQLSCSARLYCGLWYLPLGRVIDFTFLSFRSPLRFGYPVLASTLTTDKPLNFRDLYQKVDLNAITRNSKLDHWIELISACCWVISKCA